jgi:hypothetical protein
MVSVSWKQSTIERRKEQNSFGEKITKTKVKNPKTVLGSSHGEGVGFRGNFL